MTLVVAPASIFDPAVPVIGDVIYGDSDKAISGAALAQTFLFVSGNNFVYGDAAAIAGRGQGGDDSFAVMGLEETNTVLFGDAWDPGRILESCREARLDGYLPKPLSIGRLVSSIRELVHHLPPEPGAPMPPTLPLTLDRLTSFTDGDPQLEHELGALYLATATLYLREMRAALVAGGDWSRTAHSLKGASANLGAEEVARLAAAAEHERPTDASLTALERAVMAVRNFFLQRQQDERQTRRVAMAGPG